MTKRTALITGITGQDGESCAGCTCTGISRTFGSCCPGSRSWPSSTFGQCLNGGDRPVVETATLQRDETVRIPPHVAHGFLAVEPLELLYLVTNEYDASDELGFAWDDPRAAVPWPRAATLDGLSILSDRDQSKPVAGYACRRASRSRMTTTARFRFREATCD